MSLHKIDEHTLLAYADGALNQTQRAEVAALLEDSPDLREKLDALLQLQRGLRSTFDAADLLPTPGPATWARVRQRTARSGWRRFGVALSAGVCVALALMLIGLALGYGRQRGTTAAPTPAPARNDQLNGSPAPTASPRTAATDTSIIAYPDPSFVYPPPAATPAPILTSVPRWPSLALITGTLPVGRMVFAEGYGIIGNVTDPCWGIFVSHMQPTPTPHPDRPAEEGARILVLNPGDQQPTYIADGCVPVLSPDGQRVAYSKDGHIYVINVDGSQKTRLTNATAHDSFPLWSPDSQRIAFARDGASTRFLYVMSADGSQQTPLTNTSVNTFLPGMHYSWSPDGQKIAFVVQQGDGTSIVIAHSDGSRLTALDRHAKSEDWPVWSPDGKKIAFAATDCCASSDPAVAYPPPGGPPDVRSASDGYGGIITVVNADGSDRVELTSYGNGPPAWSPDGSSIAFLSMRDMRDRFSDLYIMAADGSQQTRLVTVSANSPILWAPDGQYLTFKTSEAIGDDWTTWSNLAILKLDGSQLIKLPIKNYENLTWSQ